MMILNRQEKQPKIPETDRFVCFISGLVYFLLVLMKKFQSSPKDYFSLKPTATGYPLCTKCTMLLKQNAMSKIYQYDIWEWFPEQGRVCKKNNSLKASRLLFRQKMFGLFIRFSGRYPAASF